ncbi:hypothetical protein PC129_g18141 [Phytophthora cactorum]|uniref:Uncharacterized protein n=1 Tax=Phytophthora cactorum TaxID=29920 RepID=A0A329RGA1_9STRA|nr:hypothetical protein Pcac1_g4957 [Phytophthora cactorum]KAG2827012.1 hypothetical protein PC111_g8744 [Phytophthora cactorum]KAG2853493.1 hypothetical protein PC113_g14133 [Phytophthora cactorum]KAG2896641.1 hypothetical protein PC114_g15006 [Phytophthora cactorum]KAG2927436.1 hypothetical protein PC117_g14576 [Phytophthora cactorum]
MPRTPGSKKLTSEKKVAVALFLADLAARGTRAVDAVKKAMATAVKRPLIDFLLQKLTNALLCFKK